MKNETQLQQRCFTWHWNTFPEYRGLLCCNLNNSKDARTGKLNKSLGVIAGRADLTYYTPSGKVVFIEMKANGGKQSKIQIDWEALVVSFGYEYYVIDTIEDFKACIMRSNEL